MIDITTWMKNFLQTLNETFGNRVWFVGLQGSYGRGEATETSDIDMVVILDNLIQVASPDERVIVETFLSLKNGGAIDFNLMSETLFDWSKKWITENSYANSNMLNG